MKMKITLQGQPGVMACHLTDIPGFPGGRFTLGYPEAIGDAARPVWYGDLKPKWEAREDGAWFSQGAKEGELSYTLLVSSGPDCVTSEFHLTNLSSRPWKQSLAFNCFQCAHDPAFRDHDCERTWVRSGGQFKRLVELPRVFGPRPAVQLYSVEGAPPGKDIPFVANFQATPDAVAEPWMAILSRDGKRLVATVSRPGLFLFQNREFACIHSAAGFGELRPGQSAVAVNKTWFVRATLAAWHRRMQMDFSKPSA